MVVKDCIPDAWLCPPLYVIFACQDPHCSIEVLLKVAMLLLAERHRRGEEPDELGTIRSRIHHDKLIAIAYSLFYKPVQLFWDTKHSACAMASSAAPHTRWKCHTHGGLPATGVHLDKSAYVHFCESKELLPQQSHSCEDFPQASRFDSALRVALAYFPGLEFP